MANETAQHTPAHLREIQCRRAEGKPITDAEMRALMNVEFSAPDLLEALATVVEQTSPFEHDPHGVLGFVHRVASAAFAKARGEV